MFTVNRQTLATGYSWLVTFVGEPFSTPVDPLVLLTTNSALQGVNAVFTPPLTQLSANAVTAVSRIAKAGAVVPGVPYYVRFAAVNALGTGTFTAPATPGNGSQVSVTTLLSPTALRPLSLMCVCDCCLLFLCGRRTLWASWCRAAPRACR